MQARLWWVCGAALAVAVFAGWRDWRRARRHDPDAVGLVDWPTVQVFALIAAALLGSIAFNA